MAASKKQDGMTEEKARAEFYLALVEKLKEGAKDKHEQHMENNKASIEYKKYSQAYQNFAQQNSSKREEFSMDVEVSERYKKKHKELVENQNKKKK